VTNAELNQQLAIYLIAIGEKGIPNSHLWLAVDSQMRDLTEHQLILGYLKKAGFAEERNYFVTLTEGGKETLRKVEAIYADALAKQRAVTT
jgi:hypothetical protein